jgi:hypothetical protein
LVDWPSTNILDMLFSIFKVTNIRSNIVNASQQKVFSMCIYNQWYVVVIVVKVQFSVVAMASLNLHEGFSTMNSWMVLGLFIPNTNWTLLQRLHFCPTSLVKHAQYCFEKEFNDEGLNVTTYWMNKRWTWELPFSNWICRQTINRFWSLFWPTILLLSYGPIVFQCCLKTLIIWICPIGGDFCCHGFR